MRSFKIPLEKKGKSGYTERRNSFFGGHIMAVITKDTVIGDLLVIAPETAPVLFSIGMHCLGCPASQGESIEEACMVHGTNADELVAKLNAFLGE